MLTLQLLKYWHNKIQQTGTRSCISGRYAPTHMELFGHLSTSGCDRSQRKLHYVGGFELGNWFAWNSGLTSNFVSDWEGGDRNGTDASDGVWCHIDFPVQGV